MARYKGLFGILQEIEIIRKIDGEPQSYKNQLLAGQVLTEN